MYLVEGKENGFSNIPKSIYWCIVTLTTVGYGDLSPATPLGQFIASLIMILGYGIIAVPTGIVSAEYTKTSDSKEKLLEGEPKPQKQLSTNTQSCANCMAENHLDGAQFCYKCGYNLHP
jgi:voltage-gated potassium channel